MSDSFSLHVQYSFQDIFDVLASARSFEDVLDVILGTALRELQADQGSLLLLEGSDESRSLKMLASRGLPQAMVDRGYVARKGSISEHVLRERRPLIVNDTPNNRKYESISAATSTPRKIVSALCVPLMAGGKVLGTMNLNRTRADRSVFLQDDLEAGSIIAGQAALTIENRRLQDELIQKERLAAVGQTVAGISHCIKNILAGVKGGLGITQMGLEHENIELVRQGHDLLKRNAGTLSNLVLDLLDYSKEREPLREWFNVQLTLEEVAATVGYKAANSGVEVRTEFEGDPNFYGDSDQLLRALLNLATNAVEACAGQGGRGETLQTIVRGKSLPSAEVARFVPNAAVVREWLELQVEDNGPGIAPEMQNQIWDLFFSTKGSKGTGIGLATTRKMIEEHSGTIHLQSAPGEGTRFLIFLPKLLPPDQNLK